MDEITDTSTGKMQQYSSQGKLLAESTDSNWTITDSELFTQLYNSSLSGTEQLTVDQFTEKFYLEGVPLFNEDRNLSSMTQQSTRVPFRQRHFKLIIPLNK